MLIQHITVKFNKPKNNQKLKYFEIHGAGRINAHARINCIFMGKLNCYMIQPSGQAYNSSMREKSPHSTPDLVSYFGFFIFSWDRYPYSNNSLDQRYCQII